MSGPRVEVHPDAEALAHAVAGALLERLEAAQADGEAPQVALTGGSIAEAIHDRLGEIGAGSDVDWSEVGVWWGDERYVAADSADRNAAQARRAMLDRLPVDESRVHEMPAAGSGTLEEAAAAYAQELGTLGSAAFEVVMLGIGPDGHVASLFPGHDSLDVRDALTVAEPDSPKPPPERISLTFSALNHAKTVWFVASGQGKAEAVAKALADAGDHHDTPARGVHGQGEVVWFLDRDAASRL